MRNKYVPKSHFKDCYKKRKAITFPKDYVVFDTETTGINPSDSRVIEIGAIKYHNFEKIAEFNQLINPEEEISSFISNLTGIQNHDLLNQPTITTVLKDFYDFIGDYTLVAHNAMFDINMIAGEAYRCNVPLFNNSVIDTVPLARIAIPKPHIKNHQLETIKEYFGLVHGSHRALDDCETCNCVYQFYHHNKHQKK